MYWGVGKVADAAIINFISMFLLYFYNQIMGLGPLLTGVALALAMAVDAMSDPAVGLYTDSRFIKGLKRSVFMNFSIIPSVIFFVALFTIDFIFLLFNAQVEHDFL